MTLDSFGDNPSQIGSQLFYRCVSGPRVVKRNTSKEVVGVLFSGYGAHTNDYPSHYLTMACAIGITKNEIDDFLQVLEKILRKLKSVK